jgi:hypothetical protein
MKRPLYGSIDPSYNHSSVGMGFSINTRVHNSIFLFYGCCTCFSLIFFKGTGPGIPLDLCYGLIRVRGPVQD